MKSLQIACLGGLCLLMLMGLPTVPVLAQSPEAVPTSTATSVATASGATTTATSAVQTLSTQRAAATVLNNDTTQPEREIVQAEIFAQLEKRPLTELTVFNALAYWVQHAIFVGIPANTIFLILLTPLLALCISLTRVVIGLPTLDMLVPIALSFAFVSVGVEVGLFVLGAVIVASYVAKMMVKRLRMMFYPKRSLSMLILSLFVFAALTIALQFDFKQVLNLSIFPILILMLLGDSIVSVQLHKSTAETLSITTTTIALGLFGFLLASSTVVRDFLIVYPEIVLAVVPLNIVIGRYFGLRITELFRFKEMQVE